MKYATLGEPPQPIFYLTLKQQYSPAVWLYVHTRGDARSAVSSVRSTVQTIDPGLALRAVRTVSETLDNILTLPRMGAELLGAFGLLALALAAIGTYGMMSYSVSQRTQEIGLRMALGAQPRNLVWLIVGGGMAMVLCGVLAGLIFSSVLAHSMSRLLYGIGFFDAPSFFSTVLLLVFVALIACWLPARRAMNVDPMIALRHE